jgi:hypothetical protein
MFQFQPLTFVLSLSKGRGETGNERPLDFFDLVEPFILAILGQTGLQQT